MTGIVLGVLFVVWVVISIGLSRKLAQKISSRTLRTAAMSMALLLLIPLPVIDEIISHPIFKDLCEARAKLVIDTPLPSGTTVWFQSGVRSRVTVGVLSGLIYRKTYVETSTDKPVYHYETITVSGGVLSRILGVSETGAPLIFSGFCAPDQIADLSVWRQANGITEVARPISSQK